MKKVAKKKKKKIWWVQCTVGYIQEGEDECGAVAFNQLAWRLKELTGSPRQKELCALCALIEDPHILKTKNRERAYEIVCQLIKTQRKEKLWKKMDGDSDSDSEEEMLTSVDDSDKIMTTAAEEKDGKEAENATS